MKPSLRSSFIIGLLLLTASTFALDKSISESYVKVQAAMLQKNLAELKQLWLTYVDPSCVAERKGKKTLYKELSSQIEPQMKLVKKVTSCRIQILESKVKGGKIICNVKTTQSFIIAVEGKDSVFDEVSIVEDSWQKIGDKYKIVGIKTIKETIKQDGRVIQAS